ncbi:hypothetical protein F2P81_012588 [Scophthalmus maximus]|uniref:Uncharacterized protein n=1 Tax=Scophthalmus maximus TaxID=52904 RepID=A0A6A4SSI6_SCOMX|nr:hypothetical protein F2P81_012588 [Scophthalmus maximus]
MITSSGENSLTSRVNWNMSPRTWIFPVGHEFPVMVILLARKNYDDIGIHCRVNRCSTDLQIGGLRCPAEVLILNLQRKYLDLSPYGLRRLLRFCGGPGVWMRTCPGPLEDLVGMEDDTDRRYSVCQNCHWTVVNRSNNF